MMNKPFIAFVTKAYHSFTAPSSKKKLKTKIALRRRYALF